VYKYHIATNIPIPEPIILERDIISVYDAQDKEDYWVKKYISDGYKLLNKAKTGKGVGSVGGNVIKWTKERVFEESKKYSTRGEFKKGSHGAYEVARKNNWLDEMSWIKLSQKIKPNGYWTKERTFEESKKYLTRGEFKMGNTSAYYTAVVNKWLDEFFVNKKESD